MDVVGHAVNDLGSAMLAKLVFLGDKLGLCHALVGPAADDAG